MRSSRGAGGNGTSFLASKRPRLSRVAGLSFAVSVHKGEAYSFGGHAVAARLYDGKRPLVIFDGHCALCSGGVQFMARRPGRAQFAVVQSHLGRALYEHYGLDADSFETFLVIVSGKPYTEWRGVCEAAKTMSLPWNALGWMGMVIPSPLGNIIYQFVQRNRISWFGGLETCFLPSAEQRARFVQANLPSDRHA